MAPGSAVLSVNAGTIEYGEWTIGGIAGIDVREGDGVQVVGFQRRGERQLALGDEAVWTRLSRDGGST